VKVLDGIVLFSSVIDDMFLSTSHVFLVLGLLSLRAVAQSVQSYWVTPKGNDADFSQTFTNGNALAVAWEGWNSSIINSLLHADVTQADLWVTSSSFGSDDFSQRLAGMCDTSPLPTLSSFGLI
jgi:hypothetical protein